MKITRIAATVLGLCLSAGAMAQETADDGGIPPQPLNKALEQFADKSGLQIIYVAELARGKNTTGAKPNLSATETLDQLLASTGLQYEFLNADTVTVRAVADESGSARSARAAPRPKRMAQASGRAAGKTTERGNEERRKPGTSIGAGGEQQITEIVVTGSYIRGVAPDSSPLQTYTREDIEQSNHITIPEFLASIPQNHTGGATELTYNSEAGEGRAANSNGGTGVNLRGLGSSATLVLVNGRRFVPSGNGSIVDISMIPLHLVKRIDILTDGASSLYGSDAIGGVINLVLRDDFTGAETLIQYGSVTQGDAEEIHLSQLLGTSWGSGNASLSYEFYDRGSLDADDRSFSDDARDPYQILPDQTRRSAFLSATQDVTDRFSVFGQGVYSNRETSLDWFEFETLSLHSDTETEQQNLSIGGRLALGGDWQSELVGTYGKSESTVLTFTRDNGMLFEFGGAESQFDITVLDFIADGALFSLPNGNATKLAVGAQYQDIGYETIPLVASSARPFESSRDVTAVFSELFIPFIGAGNRQSVIHRLEVSLSGRYEDYSDFGSEFTSKIGFLLAPNQNLNLRATWGESFRAPLLADRSNRTSQGFLVDNSFLQNFPDPLVPDDLDIPLSLIAFGSNPDLGPETATTWTAGFDYVPEFIPSLSVNVTYYNVDYRDRIEDAFAPQFLQPFFDPNWAPLISLNPDPEFMVFLMSQPFSFNLTENGDPADTVAFVDQRKQNFASVETSGIDLNLAYAIDSGANSWAFSLNTAYIIETDKQLLEALAPFSILNTTYNPVDLKIRGGMSWSRGNVTANLFVNYIDEYEDNRTAGFSSADPRKVSSWTTVDASVGYSPSASNLLLEGTRFALNVSNLFDRDPPFLFQPRTAVNFDPANASPLGRFISISLRKQF